MGAIFCRIDCGGGCYADNVPSPSASLSAKLAWKKEPRVQRDWWRRGVRLDFRISAEGLALAVAYALACWATRMMSLDQFYIPAGLRIAALLVFPPRLWMYLILGEYAYFAEMRYSLVETYGLTWVIASSVCLMPTVAMIMHLHRRLLADRMDVWLLSAAAASAIVVTLLNVTMSQVLWPVPPPVPYLARAVRYALGDFIAILTIAPLAMLWVRRNDAMRCNLSQLLPSISALAIMLMLGVGAALMNSELSAARASLQLSMALPAIAITCMHGWRGAAVALPILNLMIGLSTPAPTRLSFDHDTFVTQQIMAVAGTALLALGSRITHYYHQHRSGDLAKTMAIDHVRSSHIASEMDLRERALSMRNLGEGWDQTLSQIADVLEASGNSGLAKSLLRISVSNSRQFRGETSMVYPTSIEHVGLYLALQIGGINEAWKQTNRISSPRLVGDPCQLSMGLQLAAYRTIVEAASLLLKHEAGQIQIRSRCGRMGGYRGIVASVGLIDSDGRIAESTMRLAIERLTGRTLAYGGTVQCRRNRVRILLVEASGADVGVKTAA